MPIIDPLFMTIIQIDNLRDFNFIISNRRYESPANEREPHERSVSANELFPGLTAVLQTFELTEGSVKTRPNNIRNHILVNISKIDEPPPQKHRAGIVK